MTRWATILLAAITLCPAVADDLKLSDATAVTILFPDGKKLELSVRRSDGAFLAPWGWGDLRAVLLTDVSNPPQPGPNPSPSPVPPKPDPTPVPTPSSPIKAGNMWLVCVVESLVKQDDGMAVILNSQAIAKLIESKTNHRRWVDPVTISPAFAPALAQAQKEGLPRALILDAGKNYAVVASEPLKDEASTLALAKKWGGE